MRKTKSEGKTVGIFAISSQTVRNVLRISQCEKPQRISQCKISQCENHIANFAMRKTTLRISQCEKPLRISQCEISQCENHIANFAMRKTTANFAMRNFAMRKPHCKFRNAKRKFRNAKWLPTVCENSCFSFSLLIFNICSKICTKLLKLKQ